MKHASHLDPKIRGSALLTLAQLCPPTPSLSNDIQALLAGFLCDHQPIVRRVRKSFELQPFFFFKKNALGYNSSFILFTFERIFIKC